MNASECKCECECECISVLIMTLNLTVVISTTEKEKKKKVFKHTVPKCCTRILLVMYEIKDFQKIFFTPI